MRTMWRSGGTSFGAIDLSEKPGIVEVSPATGIADVRADLRYAPSLHRSDERREALLACLLVRSPSRGRDANGYVALPFFLRLLNGVERSLDRFIGAAQEAEDAHRK